MPNTLAYLALLAWPVAAMALFRALPIERALIWSILGAYLVLPPVAEFDFPLVPPLDKSSIPNLAAFGIVTLVLGRRIPILAGSVKIRLLLLLFVASPVATTILNPDPLVVGQVFVPGRPINDALSHLLRQTLFLLPFFLARRLLDTPAAQREILIALTLAGLAYALPMLLEVRLSPQLNTWIYGFFPHSFDQQMRFGGFRPVVFLGHGLYVAFFAFTALVAAIGLWRAERARNALLLPAAGFLLVVLVLCKSVGVLVYAGVALPILLLLGPRAQVLIAAVFAAVVVAYPILRGADLIPVDAMLERAATVQEERAQSLGYRLHNEAAVLAHARERPVFGWAGGNRNNTILDEHGETISAVLDGRWIIVISIFGWCGYLVEFGLLSLPLFMLAWRTRGARATLLSPYAGPVALILGFNLFELLPNSALTPFTWLIAGAILGYAERLGAREPAAADDIGDGGARPARREAPIETVL